MTPALTRRRRVSLRATTTAAETRRTTRATVSFCWESGEFEMRRELLAAAARFQCSLPFSFALFPFQIEQLGALDDDFGSGSEEESESESESEEEGAGVKQRGELLESDDESDEQSDDDGDEESEEEASSSSDSGGNDDDDDQAHANDASFAALERKSAKLDARRARDAQAAAEEAREQGLPSGADDERVALLPVAVASSEWRIDTSSSSRMSPGCCAGGSPRSRACWRASLSWPRGGGRARTTWRG